VSFIAFSSKLSCILHESFAIWKFMAAHTHTRTLARKSFKFERARVCVGVCVSHKHVLIHPYRHVCVLMWLTQL